MKHLMDIRTLVQSKDWPKKATHYAEEKLTYHVSFKLSTQLTFPL